MGRGTSREVAPISLSFDCGRDKIEKTGLQQRRSVKERGWSNQKKNQKKTAKLGGSSDSRSPERFSKDRELKEGRGGRDQSCSGKGGVGEASSRRSRRGRGVEGELSLNEEEVEFRGIPR